MLEIPIQNLLNLPEDAGYHRKAGRIGIGVKRKGDKLIIKGNSDSIARGSLIEIRRTENSTEEVDSIKNSSANRSDTVQKTEKESWYPPPGIWKLLLIIIGVVAIYLFYQSKLRKIIIQKLNKLWKM